MKFFRRIRCWFRGGHVPAYGWMFQNKKFLCFWCGKELD